MNYQTPAISESGRTAQENPLWNILLNVLIPVVILNFLSKSDRLGPVMAIVVAVAFPLGYGLWFAIKNRKINLFSAIGLASVLLTGGMGLAGSNAFWFSMKEAAIPTIFGILILASHWTSKPLVEAFLLNPELLDLKKIEARVSERQNRKAYSELRFLATILLSASMFLSAVMNFILGMTILSGKEPGTEQYTAAIGQVQGWGFLIIGLPFMFILFGVLWYVMNRMSKLTGLSFEELLHVQQSKKVVRTRGQAQASSEMD